MLKIATLNTWGLAYAADRVKRMQALAYHLMQTPYDIIALQEVWQPEDVSRLKTATRSSGYTVHHFASGPIGSGLVTLSRHPILQTAFHPYRLAGSARTVYHGDFIAGKGIGLARIQTPIGEIDVYNTHLIAQYDFDRQDHYPAHRAAQMMEAIDFINLNSPGHPVIFMGDLNTRPDQLGYRLISTLGGLRDAYALLQPDTLGLTTTAANPYDHPKQPARIDYIMLRGDLQPESIDLAFQQIPGESIPYSDHYGLIAQIVKETEKPIVVTADERIAVLQDVATTLKAGLRTVESQQAQQRRYFQTSRWLMLASFLLGGRGRAILLLIAGLMAGISGLLSGWFLRAEARDLQAVLLDVQVRLRAQEGDGGQ
jgi:endonuclease/exonuclease/phosphatase family metal-dependent hydrolase